MRYRQLSDTSDYVLGQPWYVDSPEAVAQAVNTRLRLWVGEWFLDTQDGTNWLPGVLGERTAPDAVIKRRILGTPGVTALISYASSFDGNTRLLTVSAQVQTLYSVTPISITLPITLGATAA